MNIKNNIKLYLRTIYKNYTMLLALIILIALTSILSHSFLTVQNITNIFRQVAVMGCVALGMSFVIIGGSFDMSVGSTVSLAGILAISLQPAVGVFWAMVISLIVGVTVGLINGVIITSINGTQGDSFIITFGMLTVIQAISLIITKGYTVPGSNNKSYIFIGNGDIGVIPFSIILFTVLAIIMQIFITKTSHGRNIYYMGANAEVAKLAGVKVKFYKIITYMVSGVMAAVAGLILSARVNGAAPKAGVNLEFEAVTAIVVGGILLRGGEGTLINTIIGVLIIGVISNSMNIIGISSQNQLVVKGVILIAAVCIENIRKKGITSER